MKRIFTAALLATSMTMVAQETYQNSEIITPDLNGTARYVGMGGAMEALGADLSVMSSNPAGIGLFRRSTASVSFGLSHVKNGGNVAGADNKTFMNIDQAGFVVAIPSKNGSGNFVNFGINYHKSANFNQIVSAIGNLYGSTSQNKVSFDKQDNGNVDTYLDKNGYIQTTNDCGNQVDYLYYNTLLPTINGKDYIFDYNAAEDFILERNRKGYIGEYDFNLSANLEDRFYLGITMGVKDVHYNNSTIYTEGLIDSNGYCGDVTLDDIRKITGTGVSVSAGAIFRPVETSPFRIGLSIAIPTYYDLTTENSTVMYNDTKYGDYAKADIGETYKYVITTPWQFGLSVGTTIGNMLALGATYDFADYSSAKTRIKDGTTYNWWTDSYADESHCDKAMCANTERTLKGVHTLKVGAEIRPVPELAVRLGYNYVSPMFDKNGYRDLSINSLGNYYSSTTDYTNWEATHRYTAGLGFNIEKFYADFAYQYNTTKGKFHPFENYDGINATEHTSLNNNRHQVICTLGMKF